MGTGRYNQASSLLNNLCLLVSPWILLQLENPLISIPTCHITVTDTQPDSCFGIRGCGMQHQIPGIISCQVAWQGCLNLGCQDKETTGLLQTMSCNMSHHLCDADAQGI